MSNPRSNLPYRPSSSVGHPSVVDMANSDRSQFSNPDNLPASIVDMASSDESQVSTDNPDNLPASKSDNQSNTVARHSREKRTHFELRTPANGSQGLTHEMLLQKEEFDLHMIFLRKTSSKKGSKAECHRQEIYTTPLFSGAVLTTFGPACLPQYGLLAERQVDYRRRKEASFFDVDETPEPTIADTRLFLNVNAPWSAFICGSQGSGKSHTLACMLEDCLLPSKIGRLLRPISALVFHFDRFSSYATSQASEAAYLCSSGIPVRVLVSPTNFWRMKDVYENLPGLPAGVRKPEVVPLLFKESQLDVSRIMSMMAITGKDGTIPLYVEVILRILRQMAMESQGSPGLNYENFRNRLSAEGFSNSQNNALKLRLDLLDSFMDLSHKQEATGHSEHESAGFRSSQKGKESVPDASKTAWAFLPGSLTIIDLSCPFVDDSSACALFNICMEIFLENRGDVGRIIALDEAHKFMGDSESATTFTENLLQVIRQQRHLATRVIIATQEPTISPKFLDLCSMTIVHRFSSPEWLKALGQHLAGIEGDSKRDLKEVFQNIVELEPGQALLFSPSAMLDVVGGPGGNGKRGRPLGTGYVKMRIRDRLTVDGGKSIMAV